jgi:hypothetical protein
LSLNGNVVFEVGHSRAVKQCGSTSGTLEWRNMATRTIRKRENGRSNLEAALASMLQNQATFVSHLNEDRQRFARIERDLDVIKALLLKHEEILQKLPEAVRDKLGFKPQ